MQIDVYSDLVPAAPVLRLPEIRLEILPCYVQDVVLNNEALVDFELEVGIAREFNFDYFTQVPLCDYSVDYTVTLIEQTTSAEVVFEESLEGDSLFASLDASAGTMSFETQDGSLSGKNFAIFITAHIDVTLEIQEPLSVTMDPFYVTVTSNYTFTFPNQAPQIDEFQATINVEAGVRSTMLLGYPIDLQLDYFELTFWNTTTLESKQWVNISQASDANPLLKNGLFGDFEPPLSAAWTTFGLNMIFADSNTDDPQ